MRICWINTDSRNPALEPMYAKVDAMVRQPLHPGTEVKWRFPVKAGDYLRSLYAEHLNSVLVVEEAIRAEEEGFDAVFIACWNDPLWEAREMLSIPVGSVSEQAMLAALTMGRRFAVVTVSDKTTVAIERDIRAYALGDRAITRPVRAIAPESDLGAILAATDPERVAAEIVPRWNKVAEECVRDGAEVVLIGCTFYGPLLRAAGYTEVPGTGVPVVDAATVGLKQTETMAEIARATGYVKSTRLALRPPVPERISNARRKLGLIGG
ncbi:aspartate/glutamate racemase family protein [Poseidonocella sp. HB161398]|uniref:aspartate/glutamate racemase family protein n=1 Tax=Poseidonocella sp. HB161398 TaxID=2320855 RepID=UPI001107F79B|nr:aspartate/glutamate racemase family protein [Poseidonocella sp. HB161398]